MYLVVCHGVQALDKLLQSSQLKIAVSFLFPRRRVISCKMKDGQKCFRATRTAEIFACGAAETAGLGGYERSGSFRFRWTSCAE
jgi:hypothetical protein